MKKLSITLFFAFMALFGKAQYVPQGMNYQAVARNLSGEVLSNQPVSLRINLYGGLQDSSIIYYSELHSITTSQLGLFNLIIGAGKAQTGEFTKVPWSMEQIWMEVSIKDKSQQTFTVINSSKLLAVPYAFHAGTASEVVSATSAAKTLPTNMLEPPVSLFEVPFWSTKGNVGRTSLQRLGTTDSTPLTLITNSKERLKITADGKVRLTQLADSITRETRMVVADANGDLSTQAIPGMQAAASSNLESVLHSGNETNGNILFTNNDNFVEVKPDNYNEGLKQGKFSMAVREFPGVNGEGLRSNVVGSFFGYNTTSGGGQRIPGEASYRFAGETFYTVGHKELMEFHLPEMHTNSGHGLRPFSMYIDRNSGIGSADFQMHQFNFKKVNDGNIDWMRIVNDAGNIRILMQPEDGGGSYFEMTGRSPNGAGGFYNNKAFIVNNGGGLSFVTSQGNFEFNSGLNVEGAMYVKNVYAKNSTPDPNSTPFSFQGSSVNSRLLSIGDETMIEKFTVTPHSVISAVDLITFGNILANGSITPFGALDLNLKFNRNDNNGKLNFISEAGNVLAGQVSKEGIYAKSIQTEKPSNAQTSGKLKIGSVVSATVTAVTNKYLQIEIDGVNYKIALLD